MEQEVGKYIKKKPSSVSKSSKKANHKHDWQPAIVGYWENPNSLFNILHEPTHHYGLGKYCTVCNKVQLRSWWYNKDGTLYSDIWNLKKFFPDYPVKESEKEKW